MPWEVSSVFEQRVRFVMDVETRALSMSAACEAYGISRTTGYKWLERRDCGGFEGLVERPRTPHHFARAMAPDLSSAIIAVRSRYPHWGPKKLRAWLLREHPGTAWPAASTMGDLLRRQGLTEPRRGPRRALAQSRLFGQAQAPHDVWCLDFKGWFRTLDGQRCDPLTVTDAVSRYLFCCLITEPTTAGVWPVFERLFGEHGQPAALRMDNGTPFCSTGAAGLSRLSVRWVKLGINLEAITPGRPQQNGRHERMHRTLKQETTRPASATLAEQQARFDAFRRYFNEDRPHEALGQCTPSSVHVGRGRPYTGRLDDPWYDADHQVTRVLSKGEIRWGGGTAYISEALAGELIGLAETPSDDFLARFAAIKLGVLRRGSHEFLRFSAPRPGRAEPENKGRKPSTMSPV